MGTYKRIPTVRDLEYLIAFLRGLNAGGLREAEEAIRSARLEFEREKDKAVGLGRKLDEKKLRLQSLLTECARLCKELGLTHRLNDELCIKSEDDEVKILLEKSPSSKIFRITLLKRLLMTYSSFWDVLFKIRATPKGKIYASHDRGYQRFKKSVERYGIDVTQWTFEVARDLASQLGLLNWRMLDDEEVRLKPLLGKTGYVIYLVATGAKMSELKNVGITSPSTGFAEVCIKSCYEDLRWNGSHDEKVVLNRADAKGYWAIDLKDDYLFIKFFEVDYESFERVLWREYLKLTDRIPREPVYYSRLRDKVCEALRVSDESFDLMVGKMLREPSRFEVKVSPGGGTLPLQRTTSRKHIPPKLASGDYIVYLQMEKQMRRS